VFNSDISYVFLQWKCASHFNEETTIENNQFKELLTFSRYSCKLITAIIAICTEGHMKIRLRLKKKHQHKVEQIILILPWLAQSMERERRKGVQDFDPNNPTA